MAEVHAEGDVLEGATGSDELCRERLVLDITPDNGPMGCDRIFHAWAELQGARAVDVMIDSQLGIESQPPLRGDPVFETEFRREPEIVVWCLRRGRLLRFFRLFLLCCSGRDRDPRCGQGRQDG